jgi:uncharacterized membrane protein
MAIHNKPMNKILLCLAFFFFAAFNSTAKANIPRYTVTCISSPKLQNIRLVCINNREEIAGVVEGRAFLWKKGNFHFFPMLKGSSGCGPSDVNDAGEMVGTCSFGEDKKYFVYRNSKLIDLGDAPWMFENIRINNRGQILLQKDEGVSHGMLLENGRRKSLGSMWPLDLNDNGQVAGFKGVLNTTKNKIHQRGTAWAVIWENGSEVSAGNNGSLSGFINNKRDFILLDQSPMKYPRTSSLVLIRGGQRVELGSYISGPSKKDNVGFTFSTGINDTCQIIGTTMGGESKERAVLWEDGRWQNLDDLVSPNSGWVFTTADSINQRGQIIGQGKYHGERQSFLLNPISAIPSAAP